MKKIYLSAIFTIMVGLLSARAQEPAPNTPTDNDQERILQDSVIDNSNIPDTAGSVVDDDNMIDTTSTWEDNNGKNELPENKIETMPADKMRDKNKNKMN